MSEKIIVLHPENQPEVDIYPIIKEGSIPNSVIDNQKIKSRTIINSNIALNTLKYEVLHQTLKDLIDSKITQDNMENYLNSYYYNVEETQQYVGSEINTLHQTIQNEFYSNTAIDNMLMEKVDLSLFRQYLPSTYLDLTKQENNQTSKINIHANGSIFLMNSGNKTNSGNYYFPNSIVKTEDAPNGYFVLSTTNDDYQSLYNLGVYDKITTNDDGTYTITRQTGYITYKSSDLGNVGTSSNGLIYFNIDLPFNYNYGGFISNIKYTNNPDVAWNSTEDIVVIGNTGAVGDKRIYYKQGRTEPIYIQYKLATSYTEKVEKNNYARYNQDFILEHNKSEAERSANVFDINSVTIGKGYGYTETASDWVKAIDIPVKPNTTYTASSVINRYAFNHGDIVVGPNKNTITTGNNTTTLSLFTYVGNYSGTANDWFSNYMLNEGTEPLPYQQYEGKTIHEKDLENTKNEINNAKQDKLVSNENIKTINGQSILGSGDLTITADSVFSQVTDVVDSFTINTNGTWLITCTGYNKIYASDNDTISFFGSALVSMTSASNNPHICINGTAYSCSSVITFVTSGILRVFKLN